MALHIEQVNGGYVIEEDGVKSLATSDKKLLEKINKHFNIVQEEPKKDESKTVSRKKLPTFWITVILSTFLIFFVLDKLQVLPFQDFIKMLIFPKPAIEEVQPTKIIDNSQQN